MENESTAPVPRDTCPECGGPLNPNLAQGLCLSCVSAAMSDMGPDWLDEVNDSANGTYVGPYRLLDQIGEGGMGVVFSAEHAEHTRRLVALKVIRDVHTSSQEVVQRFELEKRALSLMNHPNVARLLDAGTTADGEPYFAMELIRGAKPITQFCDDNRLPLRERVKLFIAVCEGVQHAHQEGVVHRDLKPSNILVTVENGCRVPKIIDFGIAKALGTTLLDAKLKLTRTNMTAGTPAYMSPDHLKNHEVGYRSDIYSLGVILFELIAGETPIQETDWLKFGEKLGQADSFRPSERLIELSEQKTDALQLTLRNRDAHLGSLLGETREDLDWVVEKALRPRPPERYASVNALAQDLQSYLENKPVSARQREALYLARKFIRRNWQPLLAGTSIAATLVVGAGMALWQASEKEKQRKDAVEQREIAKTKTAELSETLLVVNQEREKFRRRSAEAAESERQAALQLASAGDYTRALARVGRGLQYNENNAELFKIGFQWLRENRRDLPLQPQVVLGNEYGNAEDLACHPTRSMIAVHLLGGAVGLYDLGEEKPLLIKHYKGPYVKVAFSSDGKWLFLCGPSTLSAVPLEGESPSLLTEFQLPIQTGKALSAGTFSEIRYGATNSVVGVLVVNGVWTWRLPDLTIASPIPMKFEAGQLIFLDPEWSDIGDFQFLKRQDGVLLAASGPRLEGKGLLTLMIRETNGWTPQGRIETRHVVTSIAMDLAIENLSEEELAFERFGVLDRMGGFYLGTCNPFKMAPPVVEPFSALGPGRLQRKRLLNSSSGNFLALIPGGRSFVIMPQWRPDSLEGNVGWLQQAPFYEEDPDEVIFTAEADFNWVYEFNRGEIFKWGHPFESPVRRRPGDPLGDSSRNKVAILRERRSDFSHRDDAEMENIYICNKFVVLSRSSTSKLGGAVEIFPDPGDLNREWAQQPTLSDDKKDSLKAYRPSKADVLWLRDLVIPYVTRLRIESSGERRLSECERESLWHDATSQIEMISPILSIPLSWYLDPKTENSALRARIQKEISRRADAKEKWVTEHAEGIRRSVEDFWESQHEADILSRESVERAALIDDAVKRENSAISNQKTVNKSNNKPDEP